MHLRDEQRRHHPGLRPYRARNGRRGLYEAPFRGRARLAYRCGRYGRPRKIRRQKVVPSRRRGRRNDHSYRDGPLPQLRPCARNGNATRDTEPHVPEQRKLDLPALRAREIPRPRHERLCAYNGRLHNVRELLRGRRHAGVRRLGRLALLRHSGGAVAVAAFKEEARGAGKLVQAVGIAGSRPPPNIRAAFPPSSFSLSPSESLVSPISFS